MQKYLLYLPKVELHAHLNGSLSINSIQELSTALYGPQSAEFLTLCQLQKFDCVTNLSNCFEKFKLVHELTATRRGLELATEMVIRDFAADNVIYLELRTTPKENQHMTRRDYLKCVLAAIERARAKYTCISVKLLPSIDRSEPISVAKEIVALSVEYHKVKPDVLVGLDFSGNPQKGVFSEFVPVLKTARAAGLKLALHCAEVNNQKEIKEMLAFDMQRCGHGTFLSDEQIINLRDRNIPIECCLTSNVKTTTVSNYDNHHIKRIWLLQGITVLCTDDSGLFNTTLTKEFLVAAETFGISQNMCLQMTITAIEHSFTRTEEQLNLKKHVLEYDKHFA